MDLTPTSKVLLNFVQNRDINSEWINWAVSMLEAGHDTKSLRILAGETPLYNQFILRQLVKKVFGELGYDLSNEERLIQTYTRDLLHQMVLGEIKSQVVLKELRDLYLKLWDEHPDWLFEFYLFYCAQDDLKYSDNSHYVPNANSENIERLILREARQWLDNYDSLVCDARLGDDDVEPAKAKLTAWIEVRW